MESKLDFDQNKFKACLSAHIDTLNNTIKEGVKSSINFQNQVNNLQQQNLALTEKIQKITTDYTNLVKDHNDLITICDGLLKLVPIPKS